MNTCFILLELLQCTNCIGTVHNNCFFFTLHTIATALTLTVFHTQAMASKQSPLFTKGSLEIPLYL